jgi:hypothetical protein
VPELVQSRDQAAKGAVDVGPCRGWGHTSSAAASGRAKAQASGTTCDVTGVEMGTDLSEFLFLNTRSMEFLFRRDGFVNENSLPREGILNGKRGTTGTRDDLIASPDRMCSNLSGLGGSAGR